MNFFNLCKGIVGNVKDNTSLQIRFWFHLQLEIEPDWTMCKYPLTVEARQVFFNFKCFLSVVYEHVLQKYLVF